MANKTTELFYLMLTDKKCADYIENGWNALYNDIIEGAGKGTWENLNNIAGEALLDWYTKS